MESQFGGGTRNLLRKRACGHYHYAKPAMADILHQAITFRHPYGTITTRTLICRLPLKNTIR